MTRQYFFPPRLSWDGGPKRSTCRSSKHLVVDMIVLALWGAPCIFPWTQALQTRSLQKEISSFSPRMWPPLWRLCKVLMLTWASRRCHNKPLSPLANRQRADEVVFQEKSTAYNPLSTYPTKATRSVLLHKRTTICSSKKVQRPMRAIWWTESKL